jgi:phosphoribosylamine--glycine ligase
MSAKKILILGSGGREHAFAWKLAAEIGQENVFVLPGNAGTEKCATNVSLGLNDFKSIGIFCLEHQIDVILPGSEDPICNGIRNYFEDNESLKNISVVSPDLEASQLEGSKEYAKLFMERHHIPTAQYQSFSAKNLEDGYSFLETLTPPYVLKADGLAAGKGVLIIDDLQEAKLELKAMIGGKFGNASNKVVIEEFLTGIEFSVFVITDGKKHVLLPEAKDYKRIGEGDTGLNTGGMGSISPVPFFNGALKQKTIDEIVEPTIKGFVKDGLNYRGFVFFGLINVNGQPKVIEYNVRMGDPETESIMPRLNESFYNLILQTISGITENKEAKQTKDVCVSVFNVAGGYPEAYEKGESIAVSETINCFHAGTKLSNGNLVSNGGRVIACFEKSDTLSDTLKKVYLSNEQIQFEGRYFRRDIGKDLLELSEKQ